MHKLNRGPCPDGLDYQHGQHQWGKTIPTDSERELIWQALDAMQNGRCAYCEAKLLHAARHIEHFAAQRDCKEEMFDWHNLFGCCNAEDTCGTFKDRERKHGNGARPYNREHLVKPDKHEPDDFFIFERDGGIAPKEGLPPEDLHRAKETIRVFNLDCKRLRTDRNKELAFYRQQTEELTQCFDEMPEDVMEEIDRLLQEARHRPYITWIRHTLMDCTQE